MSFTIIIGLEQQNFVCKKKMALQNQFPVAVFCVIPILGEGISVVP